MTRVGGPLIDLAPLTAREQHSIRSDPAMRKLGPGIHIRNRDYLDLSEHDRAVAAIVAAQVTAPATAAVGFSAALVHGLPTPRFPRRYGIELGGEGVSSRSRVAGITYRSLPPRLDARVVTVPTRFGMVRATGTAATSLDLARWHCVEAAVMAMDHGLGAKHYNRATLLAGLREYRGLHGISRVRQAVDLATPWSDSPRESQVKVALWQAGLPPPHQQVTLYNTRRTIIGRMDFFWPEIGFGLEYDGRGKYLGEYEAGTAEAVLLDLQRQHAITNLGVTVYRLAKDGYHDGTGIRAIVEMHRRLSARGLALAPERWTSAGPAWLSPAL